MKEPIRRNPIRKTQACVLATEKLLQDAQYLIPRLQKTTYVSKVFSPLLEVFVRFGFNPYYEITDKRFQFVLSLLDPRSPIDPVIVAQINVPLIDLRNGSIGYVFRFQYNELSIQHIDYKQLCNAIKMLDLIHQVSYRYELKQYRGIIEESSIIEQLSNTQLRLTESYDSPQATELLMNDWLMCLHLDSEYRIRVFRKDDVIIIGVGAYRQNTIEEFLNANDIDELQDVLFAVEANVNNLKSWSALVVEFNPGVWRRADGTGEPPSEDLVPYVIDGVQPIWHDPYIAIGQILTRHKYEEFKIERTFSDF